MSGRTPVPTDSLDQQAGYLRRESVLRRETAADSANRSSHEAACLPSPSIWALSRGIRITASFNAAPLPGEIYQRGELSRGTPRLIDHFRKSDRRSDSTWPERLGIPNAEHSDHFSHTTEEEDRGWQEEKRALLVRARRRAEATLHDPARVAREFGLTVFVPVAASADRRAHTERSIAR